MTDRNVTEEQARALWERAARLQAEASARELGPASPVQGDEPSSPGDYSLDVVRRSAMEAGISEEFVDQALQEFAPAGEAPKKADAWADGLLGDRVRMIRVSQVIDRPAEEVFEAMRRVLPNAPYGLSLAGIRGGDPLEGGVMTFEVPAMSGMGTGPASSKAVFGIRHWADIPELQFRLRSLEGDQPRTEVECSASVAHARRISFWAGSITSGLLALAMAGIVGGGIAATVLAPAAIALKLATVAGVGVSGYAGARRVWRPIYHFGQNKGRSGMERLLDAISVDLQTGGAFTPRLEPRQPTPAPPRLGDPGF